MPELSIVIVSWNVRDLLRGCLRSLYAAPEGRAAQVIVVDNGSTDGSAEMVEAEFPAVQLVRGSENRGFAAANNTGLALAQGRYVLFLNPDTEIIGAALAALLGYAAAQPDVAVVAPQLLNSDGSLQPSRYRFPTFATAFFESTWLEPIAPRQLLDRYYVRDLPEDQVCDVDWVRGAALLVRRAAIDAVGPLDEGFFMYSEELDWCRRFRDAGWRVVYLPTAQVIHHGGKSSDAVFGASVLGRIAAHRLRADKSSEQTWLDAWRCWRRPGRATS